MNIELLKGKLQEYIDFCDKYNLLKDVMFLRMDLNIASESEYTYKLSMLENKIMENKSLVERKKKIVKDFLEKMRGDDKVLAADSKTYGYLVELCVRSNVNTSIRKICSDISRENNIKLTTTNPMLVNALARYNDRLCKLLYGYESTKTGKFSMNSFIKCMYLYIQQNI